MRVLFWIILGLVQVSLELEINLTRFDNCIDDLKDGEEWPVEIKEVHYDYNDNAYIDHIHGKYLVRTIDTRDKELTITVFKCSTDEPPPCNREVESIITDLHCEKFLNDDSGIWHMISQAMTGSSCGHETGLFEFEIPRIEQEYFEKYLVGGELSSRYRIHLLFHKKTDENRDRRACVEINFDVYY